MANAAYTYTLTPASAKKLSAVVDQVSAMEPPNEQRWHNYRAPSAQSKAPLKLIIGKTGAAWAKGGVANINVYAGNPLVATGGTVAAMNLFADIEADRWVAVLGGYLISAEC